MERLALFAALLAAITGSLANRRIETVADRRQIFRDEVEHIKAPLHPIEHNQNDQYYDAKPVYNDDYHQNDYRPSYQDTPYANDYATNDDYDSYYRPPSYQNDDYKPQEYDDYERPSKPTYSEPSDEFTPFDEGYFEPGTYDDGDSYPSYKPQYDSMDFDLNFNGRPQKPSYDPYPAKPYRPQEYDAYEAPVKPAKPYKPPPSYPKEVVLLQPSPALKPSAYTDKYVTPGYKPSSIPGTPGRDYPNYSAVPDTSFDCLSYKNVDYGYMYPDKEAGCQVFHACHADGRQDSFLCPLGTIFDLDTQTCDWWYNVQCY